MQVFRCCSGYYTIGLVVVLSLLTEGCINTPANRQPANKIFAQEIENPQPFTENPSTKLSFDWPVDIAKFSRGYSERPIGRGRRKRPHWGIDLAAGKGTAILAAHSGTIIYTGRDFKGYGRMVLIEGKNGWASLYAHLSKITVTEGTYVAKGQKIAEMGNTGRSTGTHLHFELRYKRGPVNPLDFLPNGQSVVERKENQFRTASESLTEEEHFEEIE